jgi:hypothetical protein
VYLALPAGFEELPFRLPVGPEQALLAATGVMLLLAVISFVFRPTGGWCGLHRPGLRRVRRPGRSDRGGGPAGPALPAFAHGPLKASPR